MNEVETENTEPDKIIKILNTTICVLFFLIIGVICGIFMMKSSIDREKQLNQKEIEETLAKMESERAIEEDANKPKYSTIKVVDASGGEYKISELLLNNSETQNNVNGVDVWYENRSTIHIQKADDKVDLSKEREEKIAYYDSLGASKVKVDSINNKENYKYFTVSESEYSNISNLFGELESKDGNTYRVEMKLISEYLSTLSVEEVFESLLETLD